MADADAYIADDPFLAAWTRTRRPPLAPRHLLNARLQHAAALQELDQLDAELDVLASRRRGVIDRMERLQSRLWRNRSGHHRRRGPIGIPPLPPPPPGARALSGRDLRATATALLHRHGTCPLRELHGLLHRYGYVLEGQRTVQRLADALAYEVEQGRCERVARGVYRALGAVPAGLPVEPPLPWDDPDPEVPRPDAVVADDPERWTGGRWPTSGLEPGSTPPGPSDAEDRTDGEDLDDQIRRAHQRCADLLGTRAALRHRADPDTADTAGSAGSAGTADLFDERWRRFAVESVPEAEKWLAKEERWPWKRERGAPGYPRDDVDAAVGVDGTGGDESGSAAEGGDDGLGVFAADDEAVEVGAVEVDPHSTEPSADGDEVLPTSPTPGTEGDHVGDAGARRSQAPDAAEGLVDDDRADHRGPGDDARDTEEGPRRRPAIGRGPGEGTH